ncbi:MAG: hypothetical protein ACNS62_13590 [Candidatus Cyclobacteriaceae bacterium M3_2C_046]
MKKTFPLVIFLVTFSFFSQAQQDDLEIHDEWRLGKEKEGIKIFTRWLPAEGDRKARQLKCETEVKSNLDKIISLIKNDKIAIEWVERAEEFKNINMKDEFHWHTYSRLNIPWPFNDQDMITENKLVQDPKSRKVIIELVAQPQFLEEKKGVNRVQHFEGAWVLTPINQHNTRIEYYMYTKTEPLIPRFITDPIVQQSLWKTFNNLRELLQSESIIVSLDYIR